MTLPLQSNSGKAVLPGPDGWDICRHIRSRSDVPVLFLTARDEEADRVAEQIMRMPESRFGHNISRVPAHRNVPETIQTRLTVSEPGDKYEQEADRVAVRVMRSQPTSDGAKESATRVSSNSSRARGNLDSDTKSFMEARFAANFDQVRVHTGRRAAPPGRRAGGCGGDAAGGPGVLGSQHEFGGRGRGSRRGRCPRPGRRGLVQSETAARVGQDERRLYEARRQI